MDLKKLEVLLRAAANGYVDLCFFSLIRSGPFEYIDLVDDPMMVVLYRGTRSRKSAPSRSRI